MGGQTGGDGDGGMSPERLAAHGRLLGMLDGFMVTQAIHVAARLGVADMVGEVPVPAGEIARRAGADEDALHRVLRFLASTGIFAETEPRSFVATPLSELLRSDVTGSLRFLALRAGEEHYAAWGEALHSVRTGRPAFERVHGTRFFDHMEANPAIASEFNRAMAGTAARRIAPLLEYDWGTVTGTVADIGGGNGTLMRRLLETHPHLRGVILEVPAAAAEARSTLAEGGLAGRCDVVEGSFFDGVPSADAHILSQILHDWDDEGALAILRTCRRSLAPSGRLLILDYVVPPGNEPSRSKLLDLNMLILLGGRERTEPEWRDLLRRGGFRLSRVVHDPRCDLIEAIPDRS